MNKQELIDELKKLLAIPSEIQGHNYGLRRAIALAKQLDEPEKPKVPQFVADWVDNSREYSFDFGEWFDYENQPSKVYDWLNPENKRQAELNTLALVTLIVNGPNAVEIKHGKLYLASFRDTKQYLGWNEELGEWFMSCSPFTPGVDQTQETWECVGIWNNPAFEIKEVEE